MDNEPGKELPFAYSLPEVAKTVFVATDDPERGQKINNGGFYMFEGDSKALDKYEKAGAFLTPDWVNGPTNFRVLLQAIAEGSPVLKMESLNEKMLRSALSNGALTEMFACEEYIDNTAINGRAWIKGDWVKPEADGSPSLSDVQARIAGIGNFREMLRTKADPAAMPTA